MKRILSGISLALALTGCAELTELSCGNADDYEVGEGLALNGEPQSAISREVSICAATASPISPERARLGWEAGRAVYCTPDRAFELGRKDAGIGSICTAGERSRMTASYRAGASDRELERDIRRLEADRETLEDELDDLAGDQDDRRRSLRREIRSLERRIDRLENRRLLLAVSVR